MSDPAISPSFDAHLRALGRLCIASAFMNRKLTDLVSVLIGAGPEVAASIFSGTENVNPRCEALKKLATFRAPNARWETQLTALAKRIQVDFARDRNRYIHDEWHDGPEGITRIDFRTSVGPPAPGEKPVLRSVQWHHDEAEKVEQLVDEIEAVTEQLQNAVFILVAWRQGQRLKPFWRQRSPNRRRKSRR